MSFEIPLTGILRNVAQSHFYEVHPQFLAGQIIKLFNWGKGVFADRFHDSNGAIQVCLKPMVCGLSSQRLHWQCCYAFHCSCTMSTQIRSIAQAPGVRLAPIVLRVLISVLVTPVAQFKARGRRSAFEQISDNDSFELLLVTRADWRQRNYG